MSYQSVDIMKHYLALAFLKSNCGCYTESVLSCLQDRIKAHHIQLLTHVLTVLATNGWEKSEETSFGHDALHALTTKFIVPSTMLLLTVVLLWMSEMQWLTTLNVT